MSFNGGMHLNEVIRREEFLSECLRVWVRDRENREKDRMSLPLLFSVPALLLQAIEDGVGVSHSRF